MEVAVVAHDLGDEDFPPPGFDPLPLPPRAEEDTVMATAEEALATEEAGGQVVQWAERFSGQRRVLEEQTATLLALIDRQKALTGTCMHAVCPPGWLLTRLLPHAQGVHPLKGVLTVSPANDAGSDRRPQVTRKFVLTTLTEEQDAALADAFSLTDHPSRGELRALAQRLGISDFLIRTAFQALRSRMRRNLAKATKKVAVVKANAGAAEAAPAGPSSEALMQSITTNRAHDEALGVQLRLLVSASAGGGVAQASFVPLFVALMTSAKTPGLRASLSDAVTASGSCAGVWPALLDNKVVDVLATWLSDAEQSRHTTLLRKFVAAALVLPVSKPEQVAPLASPLNKCRQYKTSKDVSDSATQLLAHWGRAFSGLGPGPSSKLAMAGRLPPRSAGQLPLGPQLAAPPAANTFTGPALSQAALAARIATPAPVVAKRSVDERLAGVNERAATARPMSADDILKKRRMATQQSGGLMAAPLVKRNRGAVAAQPMPPPRAQPPTRPEPQLVEWQQPPPMAAAVGDGYGSMSEEAGVQAARQGTALPVQYAMVSLIPDDPALPLHVRHEAAQHAEHPAPPFIIPDVPVEAEDAAQQHAVLAAAFPGLYGLAPPPPAWQ